MTEFQSVPDEQVVVLFQILAAEINFGYRFQTVQCKALNGAEVQNLSQLATQVDGCQCAAFPPAALVCIGWLTGRLGLLRFCGGSNALRPAGSTQQGCIASLLCVPIAPGSRPCPGGPGCRDKYMRFELEGGKCIILNRVAAQRDAPRILAQHAITFDRSADLRCLARSSAWGAQILGTAPLTPCANVQGQHGQRAGRCWRDRQVASVMTAHEAQVSSCFVSHG